MSHNLPKTHDVYYIDNVDATLIGSKEIFIVDANRFYPSLCIVELMSVNDLSSVPKISIGSFASNYQDFIIPTQLSGLLTSNNYLKYHFSGVMKSLCFGSNLSINIIEAATGGEALEYKIRIIISGVYI